MMMHSSECAHERLWTVVFISLGAIKVTVMMFGEPNDPDAIKVKLEGNVI